MLWDWILFKPALVGFVWHCSKREGENFCLITPKQKRSLGFLLKLHWNSRLELLIIAGVKWESLLPMWSPVTVQWMWSCYCWVRVEVLILHRSPLTSLMDWSGSPGNPRGLHKSWLCPVLSYTSWSGLWCRFIAWWGWKSSLLSWLLLVCVWTQP